MTQFPHDNFIKDYIPELIGEYGQATPGVNLAVEVKEIDILFIPNQPVPIDVLGLLGELVAKTCILEVYRNSVTSQQIKTCLGKLFEVQNSQIKEGQKNKQTLPESELTRLWILTPTLSENILKSFSVEREKAGVYRLPEALQTGIVVIHQLPITKETLWLRILGKGNTQEKAIRELQALPPEHPHKQNVLELIYKLLQILEVNRRKGEIIEPEDQELMRRLDALYQATLEEYGQQLKLEGKLEGEVTLTISLLKHILGELPLEIETSIINLDTAKIEALAKALLDFKTLEDLTSWLSTHQA